MKPSLPHNEKFLNPPTERVRHGGLTANVRDVVIGHAIKSALYAGSERSCGPTIRHNINYVSTADEPLVARGNVHRLAKHNALGEGAETGKLIATGRGIWRVFDPKDT